MATTEDFSVVRKMDAAQIRQIKAAAFSPSKFGIICGMRKF